MIMLVIISYWDFRYKIIPDTMTLFGICLGLTYNLSLDSLFGVFIGGGSIYLVGILGDYLFKKECIGGGDVKLMAMIGAFLGVKVVLITFIIAPVLATAYGLCKMVRCKEDSISLGPFISLGTIITIIFKGVLWK